MVEVVSSSSSDLHFNSAFGLSYSIALVSSTTRASGDSESEVDGRLIKLWFHYGLIR
jgi:hypothetical protein